jgi:hypothetical protein
VEIPDELVGLPDCDEPETPVVADGEVPDVEVVPVKMLQEAGVELRAGVP